MNGNCHFMFAGAVSAGVAINLDNFINLGLQIEHTPVTVTLLIMGGLLGGIMPDMDNPRSHVGQLTKPVSTLIGRVGKFFGKKGFDHRWILHDPVLHSTGLILSYLYFPPMLGFFLGTLSHLFLDAFNPKGIPVFFGAWNIRLGRIPSESKGAVVLTWVLTILVILISYLAAGDCFGLWEMLKIRLF